MATRKTTTPRKTATRKAPAAKANQSLAARTGRTIRDRPYASAAIATGAVAAVAAAAAGAFFFSRREKSIGETTDELTSRVKDGLEEAKLKGNAWLRKAKDKLGYDEEPAQVHIAEEALTLKETGKKTARPIDDTIADQTQVGAIAY